MNCLSFCEKSTRSHCGTQLGVILTISLTVFFSLPLSLFPRLILIRTRALIPFRRYDDTVTPDSLNKQIRKLNEEVKEIDSELEALHEDRTCPTCPCFSRSHC
jgi:hypothetical protein